MSFLSWLFALGGLSVVLPILFHLIRPAPKSRLNFSSLMFLRQSPPRLTRRSRIDNWLLLLLRALAVCLIALAFMRPFFRSSAALFDQSVPGVPVAILIDTSASMQRPGVWERALAEAQSAIDDCHPDDRISLFSFSESLQTWVDASDSTANDDAAPQRSRLQGTLATLQPGNGATLLGPSLMELARLVADDEGSNSEGNLARIVLISDFQEGSDLNELGNESWPDSVTVDVRDVSPSQTTNVAVVGLAEASLDSASGQSWSFRLANATGGARDEFQIGWIDSSGNTIPSTVVSAYVPAGNTISIELPVPEQTPVQAVRIQGDDSEFDNTFFVSGIRQQRVLVDWLGPTDVESPESNAFFFEKAFPETARRRVEMRLFSSETGYRLDDSSRPNLIVVDRPLASEEAALIESYTQNGGTVLLLIEDRPTLESATGLTGALPADARTRERSESPDDYLMLSRIDFSHPIFAPLSGPLFNDFSRIRFWKTVPAVPAPDTRIQVVASFDDESPAMMQRQLGDGTVLTFLSGWRSDVSQLGVSSRFVPLMFGILATATRESDWKQNFLVGDSVGFSDILDESNWSIIDSDNQTVFATGGEASEGNQKKSFRFTEPGSYWLVSGDKRVPVSVNLAPSESRTASMPPDRLQSLGIQDSQRVDPVVAEKQLRRLGDIQLENRQRIWKWILTAAIGVLILETAIAGARSGGPRIIP